MNAHTPGWAFDVSSIALGLSDRIRVASGDFFNDSLPKADIITMGMILHDWNLEKKMKLIRAAYDALPSGGAFIVVAALIDNARRENVFGLLMSLNMLIEFGEAFDYSAADFESCCRKVGFTRFEVVQLAGPIQCRHCLQMRSAHAHDRVNEAFTRHSQVTIVQRVALQFATWLRGNACVHELHRLVEAIAPRTGAALA